MYRIVKKDVLRPTLTRLEVEAPLVAKRALPGQFIIFRVDDDGERVPLTINAYDREKGTVDIYHNFEHKKSAELSGDFNGVSFDCLPFTIGDDASGKANGENSFIFNLDDLIVFNKALKKEDIKGLKEYYNV